MKDWKEAVAHILIMQMMVTASIVERWTGDESGS